MNKQQRALELLDQIAKINPYNRQGNNRKSEYWIYQAGFLASYLAELLAEDPQLKYQFKKHIDRLSR